MPRCPLSLLVRSFVCHTPPWLPHTHTYIFTCVFIWHVSSVYKIERQLSMCLRHDRLLRLDSSSSWEGGEGSRAARRGRKGGVWKRKLSSTRSSCNSVQMCLSFVFLTPPLPACLGTCGAGPVAFSGAANPLRVADISTSGGSAH